MRDEGLPAMIDTAGDGRQRVDNGPSMKNTFQVKQNTVKTRKEVLAEQKFERRQERKRRKGGKAQDPNDPRLWAR